MNNKKHKEKREDILSLLRLIIPTVILFIYIVVILVNASSEAKSDGRTHAESKLSDYDRAVVEKIRYELAELKYAADAAACSFEVSGSTEQALPVLERVVRSGNAGQGYIIDADGNATDTEGNKVSVAGEDWYREASELTSGGKASVTSAEVTGGDYIITVAAPIADGKGMTALRLSTDFFRMVPSLSEFDGRTQYLFIMSDGTVMSAVGGKGLNKGGNLFDATIMFDRGATMNEVRESISGGHAGRTYCSAGGEERVLINWPMNMNGWQVCELATGSYVDTEIEKYFAPSKKVYIRIVVALIIFLTFLVAMNLIITALYRNNQKKLQSKAETDLLTGLLNKISTQQTIQDYIDMVGDAEPGMFILLDIDNFKKINDTKGHAFGDEVLSQIGRELPTLYRTTDIVGRLGGDEFAVFLKDIPNENARLHMGDVTYGFFRNFGVGEYTKYAVTASIGAAMFPKDGRDFDELYKAADKAVYTAKEHGRNKFVFFGEDPDEISDRVK